MLRSFVFVGTILTINAADGKYVGDLCRPTRDIDEGVCALITDCEVALRDEEILRGHQKFKRCGFVDYTEVICCPLNEITEKHGTTASSKPRTQTTESPATLDPAQMIAERECKKIKDASIPPLGTYIIGGETATIGEFPHMVAIGYKSQDRNGYEFKCGGSLISDRFVLTAAHCVYKSDRIEPSLIRSGTVEIGEAEMNPATDTRVAQVIKHELYTRAKKYNDIALLRLETAVKFDSNTNAVCLYTKPDDPQVPLTICGWGQTNITKEQPSNTLLKAEVWAVSREQCNPVYGRERRLPLGIAREQLCAGDASGKQDTCHGDSGGPIQAFVNGEDRYRLIGITSFGTGCGMKNTPGVYVRVYSYLDWITKIVWPEQ